MNELPSYQDALLRALANAPVLEAERCPLLEATGRVLREDICADRDWPPFNRSAMDGYAVRSADMGSFDSFNVVGFIGAGSGETATLSPGESVRIATGAPVPESADAVIPHEKSDCGNPVTFTVSEVKPGACIHPQGADARAGEVVVSQATILGGQHLGLLASAGKAMILVTRRPRVAILSTGDEIRPVEEANIQSHQIRNSNGPMLSATVKAMGGQIVSADHVVDDADATRAAVEKALESADLILTIGGISAGQRDHLRPTFDSLGIETLLHGARIQPGKPIYVGALGEKRVIGLPGNPVSVLATVHLFAWPMLRTMVGASVDNLWCDAPLVATVKPNARRLAFRPSRRFTDGGVEVISWAGSGDLVHSGKASGLAELPMQEEELPAGTVVRFLPWAW